MDHLEKKKCNYCKVVLPIYKFSLNRKDEYLKSCDECRIKQKETREKGKCKHGRQCDHCDIKFSYNSNLLAHIKAIHDKIKDFECKQCDAKFGKSSNLSDHIKCVHNKIKDFECELCDAKFSDKGNLSRHVDAIHYGINDFECELCDSTFSRNGTLMRHSKICTGKRNISSGEYQVIKSLLDLGFIEDDDYIVDKTHLPLIDFCGKSLRFDFLFEEEKIVIEYDGQQHYEPVRFGGISQEKAEEHYKDTQITDKMKNDFCVENDYRMIRISYKDFADVLGILSDRLFDVVNWVG